MDELPKGYLDAEGRLLLWPSRRRRATQVAALRYLVQKFELGKTYHEKEVNAVINQWHLFEDHCLLRRELIDTGLMTRDLGGRNYRRRESV